MIAPENTLAAFQKIKENGIPGVELDIQLCRTGEIVVFHDSNLKRITQLDAKIADTSFTMLRNLDAGSWFDDSFSSEKIPTLNEVLDCLGEAIYVDIEIKNWNRKTFPIEQTLVSIIHDRKMQNRIVVSSFNPYSLRAIKRLDPEMKIALVYTQHPGFPVWLNRGAGRFICNPLFLKPNRQRLSSGAVLWKKRILGYPLVTWTEDDETAVRRYLEMGIDGIISNQPEKLLSLVSEFTEKTGNNPDG